MRNDWMLVQRPSELKENRCLVQAPMHLGNNETIVHTGTWEECVALGRLLGCERWWNGRTFMPIEEPPNEK